MVNPIGDNSWVVQGGGWYVTAPFQTWLDERYKAPTVATTKNPVVKRKAQSQKTMYQPTDYSMVEQMDIKWLNDYIRSTQYDVSQWKDVGKEWMLMLMRAQERAQELQTPAKIVNPLTELIEQKQQAKSEEQLRQETSNAEQMKAQEQAEASWIEAQDNLLLQQQQSEKNTLGYILGDVANSSYWVEQMNKIWQNFTAQRQALRDASFARLQKYKAELAGATKAELDKYDAQIQELDVASANFEIQNAKEVNDYNIAQAKSTEEKLWALIELTNTQAMSKEPLTEQETAQAQALWDLLIDDKGNLNKELYEKFSAVYPKLMNSALNQWAKTKKEILEQKAQTEFWFTNVWWWVVAITDPKTWQVVFQDSWTWGWAEKRTLKKVNWKDVFVNSQWEIKDIPSSWLVSWTLNEQGIADYSISQRWTDMLQCGELVNDYAKMNWVTLWAGNTFQDKVSAITRAGKVSSPEIWWVVAFPTGNSYWHIAIVTWIENWYITVLEANAEWTEEWGKPTTNSYKITPDMVFSKTIWSKDPFENPNATVLDIIKASKWWKQGVESERWAIGKIGEVIWQLSMVTDGIWSYQKWIFKDKLAPLTKIINENNPWDSKAVAIKAQLQWILPWVARWIFGEKWVLTDADVANYMKTLPKLSNTADANELVELALLWTLEIKLWSELTNQARNWIDTSKWIWWYVNLQNRIQELKAKLTSQWPQQSTQTSTQTVPWSVDYESIRDNLK